MSSCFRFVRASPPKIAATIVTSAIRARFFMLRTARKCTGVPLGGTGGRTCDTGGAGTVCQSRVGAFFMPWYDIPLLPRESDDARQRPLVEVRHGLVRGDRPGGGEGGECALVLCCRVRDRDAQEAFEGAVDPEARACSDQQAVTPRGERQCGADRGADARPGGQAAVLIRDGPLREPLDHQPVNGVAAL